MAQLAYTQDPAAALEGQIADSSRNTERISAKAEGAVPFGRFVTKGTNDDQCDLPDATAEISGGVALGFAVEDTSIEQPDTPVGYADEATVQIMRRGRIWVLTEDAVAAGGDVYVRHGAGGGGSDLGRCRSDADTATATKLPGATFRTSTAAAGMAIVEYDPQTS